MKKLLTLGVLSCILLCSVNINAQQGAVKPDSFSEAVYFDRVGPLIDFPALTAEELIKLDEEEKNKVRNKDLRFRPYPN